MTMATLALNTGKKYPEMSFPDRIKLHVRTLGDSSFIHNPYVGIAIIAGVNFCKMYISTDVWELADTAAGKVSAVIPGVVAILFCGCILDVQKFIDKQLSRKMILPVFGKAIPSIEATC